MKATAREDDMNSTDWIAIVGGLLAIGWINWWFLLVRRSTAGAATRAGGFTCGMRMLRGRLIVEAAGREP